jgi:serine/threonine protein kinase
MPIEQINGKPRFSSDIYAVGMLMIQAITGAEPRRFDEHPETAELIWRDRVPPDSYSSQFLNILEKMVRYDFRQRYQSAKEVLAAISLIASTSTSNYELQTVVTSSIDRSQSNGKDLDRTQVDRTQVDLLPLTQEPREDRQNKKSLPWAKILIGGASAAVLLAIAGITKFYQTPSNSKNEVVNNAPQPTSEPSPDLSAPPPEPKVRAAPTPPNSPEERLIREAKILNRFDKPLEALVKVEEALKLDLKNANAWEVKGLILVKLRRESEAIAAFDQAIELKPNSASAKQYRDLLLTTIKPNLKKP